MRVYAYNKLDAQRREIRLCTLLPGSFDEPVACKLGTVSLDDKPRYESLSYAWGPPIFDKEIILKSCVESTLREPQARKTDNDTPAAGSPPAPDLNLTATTSLYTAFRYLRKSDQERVVRILQILSLSWFLGRLLESQDIRNLKNDCSARALLLKKLGASDLQLINQ